MGEMNKEIALEILKQLAYQIEVSLNRISSSDNPYIDVPKVMSNRQGKLDALEFAIKNLEDSK